MDDFTKGYIEALLWAGVIHEDDSNDDIYDIDDIDSDTMKEILADCEDFQNANAAELAETGVEYYALLGHDFYLSRNGHGTGFWDRGYGDVGDTLHEASELYGSFSLTVSGDGKLYGLNG